MGLLRVHIWTCRVHFNNYHIWLKNSPYIFPAKFMPKIRKEIMEFLTPTKPSKFKIHLIWHFNY